MWLTKRLVHLVTKAQISKSLSIHDIHVSFIWTGLSQLQDLRDGECYYGCRISDYFSCSTQNEGNITIGVLKNWPTSLLTIFIGGELKRNSSKWGQFSVSGNLNLFDQNWEKESIIRMSKFTSSQRFIELSMRSSCDSGQEEPLLISARISQDYFSNIATFNIFLLFFLNTANLTIQ
jgi:hypothetical protein